MDINRKKFTLEFAGRDLVIESSSIGGQANSALIGTYGGTTVLVTTVMGKQDRAIDYMPLTVDYEEKFYAAGKIIGSRFIRREGRPSEDAILGGRLIDRTIRPLFDKRLRRDIQIVITILSYDEENDPEFIGLLTASTALGISDIPWNGPVAGIRIAKLVGSKDFVVNPLNSFIKDNMANIEFDSFVAGKKKRVNMIELSGLSAQKGDVISAYKLALQEFEKLIDFQDKIIKEIGKEKSDIKFIAKNEKLEGEIKKFLSERLEEVVYSREKSRISDLKNDLIDHLEKADFAELDIKLAYSIFEEEFDNFIHQEVLGKGKRPDGRKLDEVRDLYSEVGLFSRIHGSSLFIRGNTQALALTTLAAPGSEQLIETMELSGKKRFMLHYNFPPFSVGETGRLGGPGRRDIGHGALAEKAIKSLIPSKEDFPYTIRVVSEILSSNGSSSMATVSAASLSLMDAGVPIKEPAAGIAMGLMADEKSLLTDNPAYKVLTDIQGPEDHYGDMDLKIAGTKSGINAIQMDVKVTGVNLKILEDAFSQAEKARLHILDFTNKIIDRPREDLSSFAPRVLTYKVDPDRIGEIIGPGGKVINGIIDRTGAKSIDIDDDGSVFVGASDKKSAEAALNEIMAIVKDYEVGEIVEGKIIKILEFGAIVDLGAGRDGMIHVSELKNSFVKNVEEVVKLGDEVKVKVIKVENGKIGLSMKRLDPK
ncbi:MAG TPA: polyribonucleotide nucleotidyltransferase [Candidatus Paceibacterota bacterium]